MSIDIASIVERARLASQQPAGTGGAGGDERARLQRVAQEFESLLLVQMLKEMRASGSWDDDGDKETLGAESMFETLDVELAGHLAKIQGLGLSKQMLDQFDRANVNRAPAAESAVTVAPASVPAPASAPAGTPAPQAIPAADVPRPVAPRPTAVTSEFGWRSDPITGRSTFHRGVDLRAAYGQDVQATGHGQVVFSGVQGGYGNTVVIQHGDGTRTRFAHLSVNLVPEGAQVAPGQLIGRVGSSGRSTGPHLHFEVTAADGTPLDPRSAANLGI